MTDQQPDALSLGVKAEVDRFMVDHAGAVDDLIRKVGDEAWNKLHCLQLWGAPEVKKKLYNLIGVLLFRWKAAGSPSAFFATDGLFILTLDQRLLGSGLGEELVIDVGLCLAVSKISVNSKDKD